MVLSTVVLFSLTVYANAFVQELTDNNFLSFAKDKDVLLVDFFAPWCSDCQRLDPEFEKAAASLGPRGFDLAKVDCFGAGKGLCEMYRVKSWPQLKNFNRGTYTGDYNGAQTAEAMAGYISTVENSASPQQVDNPYAMGFPTHDKPSSPVIAPAPPVVGELSCAKCHIDKRTKGGKVDKHCNDSVKKACIEFKERQEEKKKYDEDDKKRTL